MADFLPSYDQMFPFMTAMRKGEESNRQKEEHALKQKQLAAILQGLIADQQRASETHPLHLEQRRLQNAQTGVQTEGMQLDNTAKGLQNQYNSKVMPSKLSADIAGYTNKPAEIAQANYGKAEQALMSMADWFETNTEPGMERTLAVQKVLDEQGATEQTAHGQFFRKILSSVPSEKFPEALRKVAQARTARDPQHISKMEDRAAQEEGDTKRTKIQAGATVEAAKIGAHSRENVAKVRGAQEKHLKTLTDARNFEQAAVLAYEMYTQEQDPVKKDELRQKAIMYAKQAQAKPVTPGAVDTSGLTNLPPAKAQNPIAEELEASGSGATAPASKPQVPNQAQIDLLKKNPSLKAQFEQKFGKGSADQYLGKK